MSRKPKNHILGFGEKLQEYAESRTLDLHNYSPYHYRLMDGGFVVLDCWTTGRYFVLMTDYLSMSGGGVERGGEKGQLPIDKLVNWLDELFFPEIKNER